MEIKNSEKNIICALSRITLSEKDISVVSKELNHEIDWEYIFNVTYKNKIHLLVFSNLKRFKIDNKRYKKYADIVCQLSYINKIKLEKKYDELQLFLNTISDEVDIVPVKGAIMIKDIYRDFGVRSTNDFDFLIRRCDVSKIDKILSDLGYVQGDYNRFTGEIKEFSPEKKILYKTKMYNLLPYVKKFGDIALDCMVFDISHSLDFSLNEKPIDEMISNAENHNGMLYLKPEHFFVHMCCHHYREASHASWIMLGNDLNLIKFCDVREYVLNNMNEDSIRNAILFAQKYGLEKAIYFTIYFLKEIYCDGYEDGILNSLGIVDTEFLYQYGENEYDKIKTRKKDFWTSLFSENNIDEISEKPKYTDVIM